MNLKRKDRKEKAQRFVFTLRLALSIDNHRLKFVPQSEGKSNRQLYLPRITNALPQEAVKVKQARRG